jgi:hypothetical protein
MSDTSPGATGDAASDPRTRRLQSLATVLASLLIPVPIVVGRLVEAALDSANPAGVDVTAGLAYLREILGWGFGSLGVVLAAIVIVFVLVYRRTRTLDALRLPLLVLVIQVVLGLLALLFSAIIGAAEG